MRDQCQTGSSCLTSPAGSSCLSMIVVWCLAAVSEYGGVGVIGRSGKLLVCARDRRFQSQNMTPARSMTPTPTLTPAPTPTATWLLL